MASIEGLYLTNIDIISTEKDNFSFTADLHEKGLLLGSVKYTTQDGVMLTNQKLVSSVFTLIVANLYNKLASEAKNANAFVQALFKENQMPTIMLEEVVKHLFVLTVVEEMGLSVFAQGTVKYPNYVGAFLVCDRHQPNGVLMIENFYFASTTQLNVTKDFYVDLQNENVKQEIINSVKTFKGTPVTVNSKNDILISGCIIVETDKPMTVLSVADYFSFLDYIELA